MGLHRPVIALIDCNSFYCSAQTLFEPWYRDKPVAVASNNDLRDCFR